MSLERLRARVTPSVDGEATKTAGNSIARHCAAAGTARSPTATSSTCASACGSRCDVGTRRTSTRSSRGFPRVSRPARALVYRYRQFTIDVFVRPQGTTVPLSSSRAARFQRRVWRRTDHQVVRRIRCRAGGVAGVCRAAFKRGRVALRNEPVALAPLESSSAFGHTPERRSRAVLQGVCVAGLFRFDRPGSVATSASIACNGTVPLSAGRCRYRSTDRRRCGSGMRCPAPLRIRRASKRYR